MRKIELVLWHQCNCRCLFCFVDDKAAGRVMPTAQALSHLRRARREGAASVDFGGGEPTLRRDLPELASEAARLGYVEIGLKTNGLLLCYPERVLALMRSGVNAFSFSVWGTDPDQHDRLSAVPGSFEMMEMAVKHAVDFGGCVEAEILMTSESLPRLPELVVHFSDLGVTRFRLWLYSLFGSNGRLSELLPDMTSAGKALAAACAALDGRPARLTTSHLPFCFLGPFESAYESIAAQQLEIATPGGVFPAETSPFEAGVQTPRCSPCARRANCGGIRPEYLERFTDKEIRPCAKTASGI